MYINEGVLNMRTLTIKMGVPGINVVKKEDEMIKEMKSKVKEVIKDELESRKRGLRETLRYSNGSGCWEHIEVMDTFHLFNALRKDIQESSARDFLTNDEICGMILELADRIENNVASEIYKEVREAIFED